LAGGADAGTKIVVVTPARAASTARLAAALPVLAQAMCPTPRRAASARATAVARSFRLADGSPVSSFSSSRCRPRWRASRPAASSGVPPSDQQGWGASGAIGIRGAKRHRSGRPAGGA